MPPSSSTTAQPAPRAPLSTSIRADLLERLDFEAETRIVGRALIVEKALEAFFATLPPVDLDVDLGPKSTLGEQYGIADPG